VLRVGIDAMSWSNRRGYARFARNVVQRLAVERDTSYILYTDGAPNGAAAYPVGGSLRPYLTIPRAGALVRRLARADYTPVAEAVGRMA
jgi:hypothetical protein